jgi:hypothetical protein
MSSWSGISLDGMVILETQNHYDEWYFLKTERVIENFEAYELEENFGGPPDAILSTYTYRTSAATLRKRLDLAGYNYTTLEHEFAEQHQQLMSDLDNMLELSPERVRPFYETIKNSKLNQWIACLKIIKHNKEDISSYTFTKENLHLKELLAFMLGVDLYYTHYPTCGNYDFPCTSEEGYAVALLEITPDDTYCILDVTELVDGGWTEKFDDLIEYHQEFTRFYDVFSGSLKDIQSLMVLSPQNETLARLLYAATITAMETYLSDTLKKQVLNREAIKKRFVKNHDFFKKEKFTLSEIYEKSISMNTMIISEIDKISFHNLSRIPAMYSSVLATNFPNDQLSALKKAIDNRHDIVHRNGKDTSNKPLKISMKDVSSVMILIDETVKHIDKQIKDGLLDDD